jgi:transporter family protein
MVYWLAIIGMICWGIAPIFAKMGLGHANPMAALVLRTLMAAGMVTAWVGVSGSLGQVKQIPLNSWMLLGIEAILAALIGDLAYYAAIKRGEVSVVTVIMASSPLVTMICAILFFGEQITAYRLIGASFVVLGIILIM